MQDVPHNGHKTAIKRTKLSKPTEYLLNERLLTGRVLDYGCGRMDDVRLLNANPRNVWETVGYDPHFQPDMPEGRFDTIYCNYVLNVIPDKFKRLAVLLDIHSRLNVGGTAYVSVRNDKRSLKGWTNKGTWQGFIELPEEIVTKNAAFVMYKITKTESDNELPYIAQ